MLSTTYYGGPVYESIGKEKKLWLLSLPLYYTFKVRAHVGKASRVTLLWSIFFQLEFDLFSKLYSDLPITGKLYFDLQALLTYRLVSLTLIYIVLLWSISFEASRTLIYKNNACCKVIYNNLFGISWYRSQFVISWTLIYTNLMPAGGFYWYRSQHAIMDFTHNVLLSVVHSCSMYYNGLLFGWTQAWALLGTPPWLRFYSWKYFLNYGCQKILIV